MFSEKPISFGYVNSVVTSSFSYKDFERYNVRYSQPIIIFLKEGSYEKKRI